MKRTLRLKCIAICLGIFFIPFVIFFNTSCGGCNDIACNGGLTVTVTAPEDGSLSEGEYTFFFDVDGQQLSSTCVLAQTESDSSCQPISGQPWDLIADFELLFSDSSFWFHTAFMEDGSSSVRGPEHVSIRVELDGVTVGEQVFSPEYETDNDYFGDEDCGYCDLEVNESMTLNS